jgi:hypothetical protein
MPNRDKESQASDYRMSRAELLTEGFKGLLLINGGGAAALLAFVAEMWGKDSSLARVSLHSIVFLAVGLALATLIPFFRYHHSHRAQRMEDAGHTGSKKTIFWYLYTFCQYLSVVAFVAGILYLVFHALPLQPQSQKPAA